MFLTKVFTANTCVKWSWSRLPWRDRVQFIAHLGWLDQWQRAFFKSLPQTDLNKQTQSIYTATDNPLIHITCFLINTHTHTDTCTHTCTLEWLCALILRTYCMHKSRKCTLLHTKVCMHRGTHYWLFPIILSDLHRGVWLIVPWRLITDRRVNRD